MTPHPSTFSSIGRPWQSHPSIREDVQVLKCQHRTIGRMQSAIPPILRQAAWDVLDLMTCGLDRQENIPETHLPCLGMLCKLFISNLRWQGFSLDCCIESMAALGTTMILINDSATSKVSGICSGSFEPLLKREHSVKPDHGCHGWKSTAQFWE